MTSIQERFLAAVHCCGNAESVKIRLATAWLEHLDTLDAREVPEEIRTDFIGLRKAMYDRRPQSFESAPLASIRKMSTSQAAAHIKAIISLCADLLRVATPKADTDGASPIKSRSKASRGRNTHAQLN